MNRGTFHPPLEDVTRRADAIIDDGFLASGKRGKLMSEEMGKSVGSNLPFLYDATMRRDLTRLNPG